MRESVLVRATLFAAVCTFTACGAGRTDVPVGASRDRTITATGRIQPETFRYISSEQASSGLLLASVEEAWQRLPGLFERLEIEVSHSDPSNWTMGNRGFRVRRIGGERPSKYLDCGSGPTAQPYANSYEVTMGLMVNLVAVDKGTDVTVRLDATAKPRSVSGHAVTCSSKGTLEQRVLTLISLPSGTRH